ncbi:MAG: hypothetical protein R2698_11350 [Microthrixaceae bacterium]
MPRRGSKVVTTIVDTTIGRVVEERYEAAAQQVRELDARRGFRDPHASTSSLTRRFTRELVAVSAVAGGTAAVPGVGTVTAAAATTADLSFTVARLSEMVLAIGIAHGFVAESVQERKAWVLSVLAIGGRDSVGVEGIVGKFGAEGGARLLQGMPASALDGVNRRLAARLLTRFASEQGAERLGRLLPFGIGAAVGAGGNYLIVRHVAKAAERFFGGPVPSPTPGGGRRVSVSGFVIDHDVIDVEPLTETTR